MVILNFIQYSSDFQTTLEFPISLEHELSSITDSPFYNHGQLRLRTIKTNSGNHHMIIFPNANMLVHRDKARSLNMLKQPKQTNKDENL